MSHTSEFLASVTNVAFMRGPETTAGGRLVLGLGEVPVSPGDLRSPVSGFEAMGAPGVVPVKLPPVEEFVMKKRSINA